MRLARRRVLVQELAAIEGLARADLLCIDKTGTLTAPGMHLAEVVPATSIAALTLWRRFGRRIDFTALYWPGNHR